LSVLHTPTPLPVRHRPRAVTFDFGQVLASLDPVYLAEKLAGNGIVVEAPALDAAMAAGWEAYGLALRSGGHGGSAWKTLLRTVIEGAGAAVSDDVLTFLFDDQRANNLWRRPVPGMIDVVRRLRSAGIPVGIVSNSEGALAKLVASLGWTGDFPIIADSGVLGLEKPDAAIFRWTATRLGVAASELVHVGDSWAADVEGALDIGAQAIWFVEGAPAMVTEQELPARLGDSPHRRARIAVASNAEEVERAARIALALPPL
jgi:HAD superfamily hydrolase (TIGR01549 family)